MFGEVGDSDRAGPAVGLDLLQGLPGLDVKVLGGDRPVGEEQVHLVKPQLAQTLLERPPGLVGPMLPVGELGRDKDLVARQFAAPEGLPDALLVLISLSGVDQADRWAG